ncbi:ArsA-related P-loop ATPase [Deltaproteobacteria bacterium TL4]
MSKINVTPFESMDALFSHQLILVSGKGGVGKTTLAVFLAQLAASRGKNVLLCHVNRLVEEPWETAYLSKYDRLSRIFITPAVAMKEYVLLKLKSEKLYSMLFEGSGGLSVLRKAAPALNELVLLGKVYWECKQRTLWVSQKWDHVVVDMPSTGHALTMLNISSVVREIFGKGIVAAETAKMEELFKDRARTCLVLAALPEYMVIQETLQFCEVVRKELHVELGPIFLNRMPDKPLQTEELALYEKHRETLDQNVQDTVNFFQNRYSAAVEHLDYLEKNCGLPVLPLPMVFGGTSNPEFFHLLETQIMQYWLK